jgi:LPXTG-motif cell wall-anchored protein
MPTRVTLNQFGARQDDVSLLALGVSGIVMIGALALLVARRRINSK